MVTMVMMVMTVMTLTAVMAVMVAGRQGCTAGAPSPDYLPNSAILGQEQQDGRKAQTYRHHQRHQEPTLVQIRAHHDRRHRGVEVACLCLET